LENVQLVEGAVADSDGNAEIFHSGGGHECSTSLRRDFVDSRAGVRSSLVPTLALDSFLEEREVGSVSLIKLDIETGEPDALRGASRTLLRDHPTILCEVLSDDVGAELKSLLSPLGYRFYHLTAEGPVEQDEIVGHPEWLNYLFTVMPPDEVVALSRELK